MDFTQPIINPVPGPFPFTAGPLPQSLSPDAQRAYYRNGAPQFRTLQLPVPVSSNPSSGGSGSSSTTIIDDTLWQTVPGALSPAPVAPINLMMPGFIAFGGSALYPANTASRDYQGYVTDNLDYLFVNPVNEMRGAQRTINVTRTSPDAFWLAGLTTALTAVSTVLNVDRSDRFTNGMTVQIETENMTVNGLPPTATTVNVTRSSPVSHVSGLGVFYITGGTIVAQGLGEDVRPMNTAIVMSGMSLSDGVYRGSQNGPVAEFYYGVQNQVTDFSLYTLGYTSVLAQLDGTNRLWAWYGSIVTQPTTSTNSKVSVLHGYRCENLDSGTLGSDGVSRSIEQLTVAAYQAYGLGRYGALAWNASYICEVTPGTIGFSTQPAPTVLTSPVTSTATSWPVVSSSGFNNLDYILCEGEIAQVNGAPPDGTHLNVTRAARGTTAFSHYGGLAPQVIGRTVWNLTATEAMRVDPNSAKPRLLVGLTSTPLGTLRGAIVAADTIASTTPGANPLTDCSVIDLGIGSALTTPPYTADISSGKTGAGGTGATSTYFFPILSATNANPVVFTVSTGGIAPSGRVIIAGATGGWTSVNGQFTATQTGGRTFSIPIDSTALGALSGSPTVSSGVMPIAVRVGSVCSAIVEPISGRVLIGLPSSDIGVGLVPLAGMGTGQLVVANYIALTDGTSHDSSILNFAVAGGGANISSGKTGSGSFLPLRFFTNSTLAAIISNAQDWTYTGNLFSTNTNTKDIGSTTVAWNQAFLTNSNTENLVVAEPGTSFGTHWQLTASATNHTLQFLNTSGAAFATMSTVTHDFIVDAGIFPLTGSTYDLGSGSGDRWNNLFVVNADISGTVTLVSPLTVPNGGTGHGTFTAHGVMVGNGTSALNVTAVGTAGQVFTSNGVGLDPTFQAAGSGSGPFTDANPLLFNAADNTKLLKWSLAAITTGTTRTWTVQNTNLTVAGIDVAQTFSATQTFQGILPNVTNTYDSGTTSKAWNQSFTTNCNTENLVISAPSTSFGTHFQLVVTSGGTNQLSVLNTAGSALFDINESNGVFSHLDVFPDTTLGRSLGANTLRWNKLWAGSAELSTPLTVPSGGTGNGTFTTHGVVIGSGTSALNVTTAGTTGQVLTSNGSGADPTFQTNAASSPFTDAVALLFNAADNTKLLKWSLAAITTGTTRTWTVQNSSLTVAGIDIAQTFTATQTVQAILPSATNTYDAGSTTRAWNQGFFTNANTENLVISAPSTSFGTHFQLIATSSGTNQLSVLNTVGSALFDINESNGVFSHLDMFPSSTQSLGANTLRWTKLWAGSADLSGAITLGTALTIPNGGTGQTALTAHGVLVGNGSSALNVTTAGTAGYFLTGNGAADPTFQSASTTAGVVGGLSTFNLGTAKIVVSQGQFATASTVTVTVSGLTTLYSMLVTPLGVNETLWHGTPGSGVSANQVVVSSSNVVSTAIFDYIAIGV